VSKAFNESDCQLLEDILRLRRDVRGNHFLDVEVSDEIIERLMNAALLAPSVGYSQPWQFVVIRDTTIKNKIHQSFLTANVQGGQQFSGEKQKAYNALKLEGILEAPVNIAIFYKPSDMPVLGQASMKDMGRFSVVCAIQNMWLMARALNIGVGWVSIIDAEQVKLALNAKADTELIGYLCIGYVDEFLAEPELKQKGWAKQKNKQEVIFKNGFPD